MSKRKSMGSISMVGSEDEVSSDSDGDIYSDDDESISDGDESIKETPMEKRSRLARQYLDMVKGSAKKKVTSDEDYSSNDDDDDDDSNDNDDSNEDDNMNMKLQVLRQKATSSYVRPLASKIKALSLSEPKYYAARSTPTCVSLSKSLAAIGTKSGAAFTLDVSTGARTYITPKAASTPILSVGLNSTRTSLACGLSTGQTQIYDLRTNSPPTTLPGHKSSVTSLSYSSTPPHSLYTASSDRCIRHYTSTHQYVETLYGHQSSITSLTIHNNKPITTSRDRTLRIWDVVHGTHGIYRPGSKGSSEDCCVKIGEKNVLTGSEDGSVRLWEVGKKKPMEEIRGAHGGKWVVSAGGGGGGGSDFGVTGSWDGYVNLWGLEEGEKKKSIKLINRVEVEGYVNGVAVDEEGRFAVLAVGREHRLGRWEVVKTKERVGVLELVQGGDEGGEEEEAGEQYGISEEEEEEEREEGGSESD
ncbi:hypothetical protein TrST_g588 [Triparma strigata]|uniref:WD40 repeat-like protein n=1 Tax=Triparma strigata TaxID=1606541 RepID=A0A9W7ED37_9STRA|nr:hypothetical protein TrST_g588 [Triparma strigata]